MHQTKAAPEPTPAGSSYVRVILTVVVCILSIAVQAKESKGGATTNTYPNTNVRHKQCLGTRGNGVSLGVASNWAAAEYKRVIGPIARTTPDAFDSMVRPCVMKKVTWREFYNDPSVAPISQAQARDPNWENYRWNATDTLLAILDDPVIQQANAMVSLLVADQSSAQKNSPPQWYIEAGHTYGDAAKKRYRNRLDRTVALDHLANFYIALLRRYGNHPRLHSLVLGEYFSGPAKSRPVDMDLKQYYRGRRTLWKTLLDHIPLDANGNRLPIYQTNPILKGGVNLADLEALMIGVSYSDIALFEEGCGAPDGRPSCHVGSFPWIAQQLYGTVPLMLNGDDRVVRNGRQFGWTGIANPFSLKQGDRELVTPQQLFWYHGSRGVLPIDSLFIKIAGNYPQTAANLADAVAKFAPGGSMNTNWGTLPAKTPSNEPIVQADPIEILTK